MKDKKFLGLSYPWFLVSILWVVAFLNYLDRILITSMRDPIVADFQLNDAQFGLLTSVFLWSYGFLSPFGGYFADKIGRRKVIIFSVVVWSAATVFTGYAQTYHQMIISRIIMGMSEACYIPAALALITDYHRGKTRSLATGIHMSGLYAGLALGGVGGFIAEAYGWRFGFHLFGIFGILYSLVLIYGLKDKKAAAEESAAVDHKEEPVKVSSLLTQLFKNYAFIIILIFFCVLGMVNWLVNGWMPTFLKESFDLGLGEAGISATAYIQIGSFVGVLLGGIISDRWSATNPNARLNMIIIGFLVGAPFLFLLSFTSVFAIAIAAMFIFGLARGFNDSNLMPALRQVINEKYIATGYGFLNFLSTIVGGLMVYVGGALKDAAIPLSVVYQFSAACLILGTLSLFLIVKRTKK